MKRKSVGLALAGNSGSINGNECNGGRFVSCRLCKQF